MPGIDKPFKKAGKALGGFFGGGPDIDFPEPTDEERALLSEMLSALRQSQAQTEEQLRLQTLLQPALFESAGLIPLREDGDIVGFERAPDPIGDRLQELQLTLLESALGETESPEVRQLRQDVELEFLRRSQAALRGELPVDPALERQITEGRETLAESLRRELGPGFATSTPGIEALAAFDQRAEELRSGARRAELTLSEQLGGAREARDQARLRGLVGGGVTLGDAARLGTSGLLSNVGQVLGQGFGGAGQLAQIAGGFGGPLAAFQAQRAGEFRADVFNAQQPTLLDKLLNVGLGVGGQVAGLALGSQIAPGLFTGGTGAGLGSLVFQSPLQQPELLMR